MQSQVAPCRGLSERKNLKASGVGHGCDCQLGDLTCVWAMPKLDRPGSCLLGKWQLPKLRTHLASTCFFSGSAVPPPNSNNWAAGRSRRSAACGLLLGSVISHIPSIGHSLCQATRTPLCTVENDENLTTSRHPFSPFSLSFTSRPIQTSPCRTGQGRGGLDPSAMLTSVVPVLPPRHTRGLYPGTPGLHCTESHWMASRPLSGL